MIVPILIVIIASIVSFGICQKITNASCVSERRLDGKTALVTGGTAGIGLEVACALARRGARVLVAGPYQDEGEAARRRLMLQCGVGATHVRYLPLDLGDSTSTRRAAADILLTESRLDILVNNAGVAGPCNRITDDGMNFVMQVNYFGTFQLTLLLLPLLRKAGRPADPSRIINTASILHRSGTVDLNNFACKKVKFFNSEYYSDSKFCIVLFTRELARRMRGLCVESVVVNSVNPGAVGTGIFSKYWAVSGWVVSWFFYCCCKTPWQGAQTALHVALDEAAGGVSGEYFENCRLSRAVSRAYNDQLAKRVWDESLRLVKVDGLK